VGCLAREIELQSDRGWHWRPIGLAKGMLPVGGTAMTGADLSSPLWEMRAVSLRGETGTLANHIPLLAE
jgi:hypothetical protein